MATIDPNQSFYDAQNTRLSSGMSGSAQNIPTKAPTGETKVSQPAVTPTTVVSGQTFADHVNNNIVPTMNQAQQTLADYQAKKKISTISKATKADGTSELYMSDGTRVRTDANGNVMPSTTPEQQIADTADAGMKFAYASDGTRTQIPLNDVASKYGMSDTNPTVAPVKPVLDTAELSSGTQVKKFNDNTYGLYDQSGKYIGSATETQYNNAKNSQAVLDKINLAINGNYPLKANQQAQIDAVKSIYANLVKEQETANANLTGGMTVAQNLYGMGNTTIAMGAIKTTIDQGIAKVNEIQSKMASDVAKMTNAFQSDNLEELKTAFNSFSANQKALQDNIDKIHDDTAAIEKEQRTQRQQAELAVDNDIRGLLDTAAKNGATPEQINKMNEALQNHDMAGAVKAGGETLMSAAGTVGEYYAYARDAKARNIQPMSFDEYQTKDANRKAKVAAAGAARLGGEGTLTKNQLSIINGINNVIMNSPVYKRVQATQNFAEGVKDALSQETGPADIAAINQYQKVIDEGAVTRDQDVKLVASAQTLQGQLNTWMKGRTSTGEKLGPELRKQMFDTVDALYKGKVKALLNSPDVASQITIAKRSGISEDDTVLANLSNFQTTVGDDHIKEVENQKQSLKTFMASSPDNTNLVNSLRSRYPTATPEQIYQKLKDKNLIQ